MARSMQYFILLLEESSANAELNAKRIEDDAIINFIIEFTL